MSANTALLNLILSVLADNLATTEMQRHLFKCGNSEHKHKQTAIYARQYRKN